MSGHSGILLSLATGTMEFCWIYAWTSFTITIIVGHSPPFSSMTAAFLFSALASRLTGRRGWRIVNLAGMHILGYVCTATLAIHSFYYPQHPVFETPWIIELIWVKRSPAEWFHLIFMLIWVGLLWYGGAAFAHRKKNYTVICARFDIGLAAFFVLLLTKLALRVKGGIITDDHLSSNLVYPYLLLALTAIGMARVGRDGSRHFLPGYGGIGIFMSFVALVLLSASSLALFLIPFLTQAAEVGQRALKGTALLMLPIVTGVVRFMFMGGKIRPDPPSGSSPGGGEEAGMATISGWWTEILDKIIRRGLEIMAIAFIIFIVVLFLYLIFRWLFSRTAINQEVMAYPRASQSWFFRLKAFFLTFWGVLKNVTRDYTNASELFLVLSEWGRRSGLPRTKTDTPLEFGARLSGHFPALKKEISSIVGAFNIEAYGKIILTDKQLIEALGAWRAIRSPVHWPRRFKMRFINKMPSKTKPFALLQ